MVDPVTLIGGLGGVYTICSASREKLEGILNRDEYSDQLEQLEDLFLESLQSHLAETLSTIEDVDVDDEEETYH